MKVMTNLMFFVIFLKMLFSYEGQAYKYLYPFCDAAVVKTTGM
jgi:hypothetical protein